MKKKVRNALKNGFKVLYEVTPIYNTSDLMAYSFRLQATSDYKDANFDVELANRQPGYVFNYATGTSKVG